MINKWDERYLLIAKKIANWSKDPSTQVGAVTISKNGSITSQGYNGFPRNITDKPSRYENKELKYQYIVHAEMNCIYHATLNGVSLRDNTLYIHGLPVCNECAKGIIQVGITRVVVPFDIVKKMPKRWKESCDVSGDLFQEAGVRYDFV